MSRNKQRSKSLVKTGFDINPNQLSTNFNKKNQIGFKLKLLENLRNSKKTIEKFEENIEENYRKNEEDKNENKRIVLLNPLKKPANPHLLETDNLVRINSNERKYSRPKEKSLSNNNLIDKSSISALNNSGGGSYQPKSFVVKGTRNGRQTSIKRNLECLNFKLIEDVETLTEINTDLSAYVSNGYPLDEETKIIDVLIELDNCLIESKNCKSQLIKLIYVFHKYFNEEKNIFLIESANKTFYKLVKVILASTVASLFVILYVGYDLNIKAQIKKLHSSFIKPVFHIYEVFSITKLCKISEDGIERFNKHLNKYYKLQKSQIKQSDLCNMISKEVDNSGLSLKQFSK